MAVKDNTVVVKGSTATLNNVTLWPQADGSVVLTATGAAQDSSGNPVQLNPATIQMKSLAVLDNLMAKALSVLRVANGLE